MFMSKDLVGFFLTGVGWEFMSAVICCTLYSCKCEFYAMQGVNKRIPTVCSTIHVSSVSLGRKKALM